MPLFPDFGEVAKGIVERSEQRLDSLDESLEKLHQMGPAHAARAIHVCAMIADEKEWFRKVAGYEFVGQYMDYGTKKYWDIVTARWDPQRRYAESVQRAEAEQRQRAEAEHRSVAHARNCTTTTRCPGTE